jgi:uncharacterized membrane protein YkoI
MRLSHSLAMLCAAASIGAVAAAAEEKDEQENTVDIQGAIQSGEILPLEEILQRALSQFPGKVTEIELGSTDGRYRYEVDVTDDAGVKRELVLDAKTAELLSMEIDNDDEESASAGGGDEEAAADDDDDDDEFVATDTDDAEAVDDRK